MKKNIKLTIEYDGSRYAGWQRLGKDSNQTSIQGKLEYILTIMTGEKMEIIGSGRTDSGVHALGQVANFHIDTNMTPEEIKDYLNRYLPHDIAVISAAEVPERFHSRLNAVSKTYVYHIDTRQPGNVFNRRYRKHSTPDLDIEAMRKAARYLIGRHDFKAFSSVKKSKKSTLRTIYSLDIEQLEAELKITIRGNGFLYNMVRIIVGTLMDVGQGLREPAEIKTILDSQNRELAGRTIEPEGLFLKEVEYPKEAEIIDIQ